MRRVRVVLDTNVLVSGLISPAGPPGRLIEALRQHTIDLTLSEPMVIELREVLARPHLQKYLPEGAVDVFVQSIDAVTTMVRDPLPDVTASPDPKDNMVLATALAGRVELIVSGDKQHLLSLGSCSDIPILKPADAIQWFTDRQVF